MARCLAYDPNRYRRSEHRNLEWESSDRGSAVRTIPIASPFCSVLAPAWNCTFTRKLYRELCKPNAPISVVVHIKRAPKTMTTRNVNSQRRSREPRRSNRFSAWKGVLGDGTSWENTFFLGAVILFPWKPAGDSSLLERELFLSDAWTEVCEEWSLVCDLTRDFLSSSYSIFHRRLLTLFNREIWFPVGATCNFLVHWCIWCMPFLFIECFTGER